jgi:hypothetical protein
VIAPEQEAIGGAVVQDRLERGQIAVHVVEEGEHASGS